jgi:DNA-binding response OmpR family regulator
MARVLLFEDEPSVAAIVAHKLGREGHQVRCLEQVAEPAELDEWHPDLVLLDLELDPDLRLLAPLAARWPVLTLTVFQDDATPPRALAAGAVATLAKPFKPTVLARLVARLTGGPGWPGREPRPTAEASGAG